MSRICFLVLGLCTIVTVQGMFPDDPKPCKYGDGECLAKIINYFIKDKGSEGENAINLVKLDPLNVEKMNIKQGDQSPVNIDVTFTKNKLHGLTTITFAKTRGFGSDLSKKHEVHLKAKMVSMVGPYSITGKVLILPIRGTGTSNMTMTDIDMVITFTGKPTEKDGETYMKITNFKINVKPGRAYYTFTNLFNGDKALGDNMNAFLNVNWDTIYAELKPAIDEAFGKLFERVVAHVFEKLPYAKFFAE